MRSRLALAVALVAACSKHGGAADPLPGGGYSYLVTPTGHMYRVLKAGPVIGAEGKKLGTMVSYAAETREIARIATDAEELVAALGPEMELGGETSVIVQANVGYDPRKMISTSVSYNAAFEHKEGGWVRLPPKPGESKELEGVDGSVKPPDDPSFPFDPASTARAADAAAAWVALIDAGNIDGSIAAMTDGFRTQISADQWRGLVAQRSGLAAGAKRVELYRMQTRNASVPILSGGGAAIVQYELRPAQGGRFVERVMLLNEKDRWRPAGYAVQRVVPR